MRLRTILLGVLVLPGSFIGATLLMNVLWPVKPSMSQANRPVLVAMPPLQPLTGTSVVLAPAVLARSAIRAALEAQAPRNLSGTPQNPVSKLLSSAKLTFTVNRRPLAISGQPGVLLVTTPLSGQFEALGTLTGTVGSDVSAFGNVIGQQVQNLAGKAFDQHTDTTAR
jgi:hypothetical protein